MKKLFLVLGLICCCFYSQSQNIFAKSYSGVTFRIIDSIKQSLVEDNFKNTLASNDSHEFYFFKKNKQWLYYSNEYNFNMIHCYRINRKITLVIKGSLIFEFILDKNENIRYITYTDKEGLKTHKIKKKGKSYSIYKGLFKGYVSDEKVIDLIEGLKRYLIWKI